jgi:hypothetical protein
MKFITNPPRGLVSLFGLNDMGKVPNILSDQIVGTFDLSELVLLNRELIQGNVGTGTVPAAIVATTVPAGELWYVWSYTVRTPTIPAGEQLQYTVGFTQFGTYLSGSPARSGPNGYQISNHTNAPFWLGPGTGLGVGIEYVVGAGLTLTWQASIVRLRV